MLKCAAIAAIALVASSAFAADVPAEISARYDDFTKSMTKWDPKAFGTFFAKEFVLIEPNGEKVNRKDFMDMVNGLMEGVTKMEAKEKLLGATMHKGGVVAVKCDMNLTLVKADGNMLVHEICTDYWKKVNGTWVMIKTLDWVFTVEPAN